MSHWPGKYVIGLTGNIATGKSVVRKMLEHLGAYGIDADALANRAIVHGAPAYQEVVDAFGNWILKDNGEIDRGKLGRLVFNNSEALQRLEKIIHPLVIQAIDLLIQRAKQRVVVVEAIKLLESGLGKDCDSIWATTAPESIQKTRLMKKRGMTEDEALMRIRGQPPQHEKNEAASVVIHNTSSFEDTWKQVVSAWKSISPAADTEPLYVKKALEGEMAVQRGRPRDSSQIAEFMTRLSRGKHPVGQEDIMAAFGEKAFLLLMADGKLVGLAGWQVENLVARTTDLCIDPGVSVQEALKDLVTEIEQASQDLQCEASLLFLPSEMAAHKKLWNAMGYEIRSPQSLGVQAWQDAAQESMPKDSILLFKQLRQDRVLRPI